MPDIYEICDAILLVSLFECDMSRQWIEETLSGWFA